MADQGLMRVSEAAGYLSIGRSTVYELIGRGVIPTVHIGCAVRVPTEALQELVRSWAQTSARIPTATSQAH